MVIDTGITCVGHTRTRMTLLNNINATGSGTVHVTSQLRDWRKEYVERGHGSMQRWTEQALGEKKKG